MLKQSVYTIEHFSHTQKHLRVCINTRESNSKSVTRAWCPALVQGCSASVHSNSPASEQRAAQAYLPERSQLTIWWLDTFHIQLHNHRDDARCLCTGRFYNNYHLTVILTIAGIDERAIKKIVGHAEKNVTQIVYTPLEIQFFDTINKISVGPDGDYNWYFSQNYSAIIKAPETSCFRGLCFVSN